MALTAAEVLAPVSKTLLDSGENVWTDAELLEYLNNALAATVLQKHDAFTKVENVTLAAGSIQVIPADGVELFDITHNVGDGGTIRQVDKAVLDRSVPGWMGGTQKAETVHYMTMENMPEKFWVYPPSDGTSIVEMVYGAIPTVESDTSLIQINDSYADALYNHVLGSCYSKNSKRGDITKANMYYGRWAQAVGITTKTQLDNAATANPKDSQK